MIGLDTNIVLRWLVDDSVWPDDAPGQTTLISEKMTSENVVFFVNSIVFVETIWILTSKLKLTRSLAVQIVDKLLQASNVRVENRAAIEAAGKGFAAGPADFGDCLIGEINRQSGCSTTLTFDRRASKVETFTRLERGRS